MKRTRITLNRRLNDPNCFYWGNRYSDTDTPDRHGRWMRICYYKENPISLITKTYVEEHGNCYKVHDFFPSQLSVSPCLVETIIDKDLDTIKKDIENRFMQFVKEINS